MMASMRNIHIVLFIWVMCVVQTMAQVCPYSDPSIIQASALHHYRDTWIYCPVDVGVRGSYGHKSDCYGNNHTGQRRHSEYHFRMTADFRHEGCTCGSDTLECYDLQQIPTINTGVNVSQIAHVTFFGGNITSLSKESLPSGLQSISFIDSPLTNISEDAFEASAATLQSVSFASANLNSLPTALKKLTSLNILVVVDTPIHVWDDATVTHIGATLKHLGLYQIGLTAWPSWISNFHVLQELDLSWDSLADIPDNAFISFKDSLRGLYLENIGLTHVPQALSTLSNLANLVLSNNNLTHVTELKPITESPVAQTLSKLHVDFTGLTRVPDLSNLTNLTYLRASNNRISDVPAGSLPVSLTQLYLSDNSISSVPADVARMANLSHLDLTRNHITNIEPDSFPSSLTELNLSYNNLTIITNTTFRNLSLLQRLSLGHNAISAISLAAFSDLVSLRSLNFGDSHLTNIPLAFTTLNSQTELIFTTTQSLACPCPAPQELIKWFTSLQYPIQVNCSNGQPINSYLQGQCEQPSAAP